MSQASRGSLAIFFLLSTWQSACAEFEPSGLLEIHYINIGQGGSTLIIGPDGTRVLYDFGKEGKGHRIATYLRDVVQLEPSDALHFAIVSHRDSDHYGGYREVVGNSAEQQGYDILVKNYDSGSDKTPGKTMKRTWLIPAKNTRAGAVDTIPLGLTIALGDGATLRVIAANGEIFDAEAGKVARNENDKSVVLYLEYGRFDYILDGDLGGGPEACTDHQTSQKNFQVPVAEALLAHGWMSASHGVDVMHVSHHGAESSTPAAYFNLVKPEVALISVGRNQSSNFHHPREDVVDNVLLHDGDKDCLEAPPVQFVLQTEEGVSGESTTGKTSFSGTVLGDIKVTTDGVCNYRVVGSGNVAPGSAVAEDARVPVELPLDDPIDINAASLETLRCLPGIGLTLATRILERRAQQPFASTAELTSIEGIGDATFAAIRDQVEAK